MTANDFLNHQLAKASTDRGNKFGGFNTWTLGMAKLMLEFAEAYHAECERKPRPTE